MSVDRIAATLREIDGLEAEALGARHLADAVRRLQARAGVDASAYADLVTTDGPARDRLIGELLVHETSFFRYPASFQHLASFIVARAAARPGPVRVLSAACATGQEPYSIAIALLEAGLPPERISVDAFDRSSSAIEKARSGRFDRGGTRGLDATRASRWFESHDDARTVLPSVRGLVRFEIGSCLDAHRPFANVTYDAIFCRNLLIYLTEPARRHALSTIRASLTPDGVLYLGHAEILVARAEGFAPIAGSGIYACLARATDVARPSAAIGTASPRVLERAVRRARTVVVPAGPPSLAVSSPVATDVLGEALVLANAGRVLEACALLEAEVARGQSGADHYHLLALVRRAAGKVREADDALGRALYLDPTHVGALLLAAVAAEGRGERSVAARLHARARAAVAGKHQP